MKVVSPGRGEVLLGLGACVVLVTVACLLPPAFFEGTDWLRLHLPNKVLAAEALRSGRLPLWNPYVSLGRPFLADIEAAVLYPPNLLYLVLDPSTALLVLTLAHYALALAGMLVLGRALGLARWTAWLAAACFLWSGPLVLRLTGGLVPFAHALCYLPLLLFLALRLQDAFSARRLATLSAALALQLVCGHPQAAWVSWLGVGAFLLGRALPPAARPWRRLGVGLAGLAAALVAAFALAAPVLLPLAELASEGNRAQPSLAFAAAGSLEGWQWTSLAFPDGGRRVFGWETNLYAGLLAVVAGVAGLALPHERNARGLAAMGLAGGLVACGTRTPAFVVLYYLIPGLSSFHLHARAALLVTLALVLGSALFLSRARPARRSTLLLTAGAALAVLGPLAFRLSAPAPEAAREPFPIGRLVLGVAVAVLAGLSLYRRPGRVGLAVRASLAVLVVLELGLSLAPVRRVWTFPVIRQGERQVFEGLLRAGLYAPSGVPPRVALPPWAVRENAALLYKWSSVAGYNALTLDRVWWSLHVPLGLTPPSDENTYPSRRIYEHGPFPFDSMNLVAGWRSEPPGPGARSRPGEGADWQPPPGRPVLRRPTDPRAYLSRAVKPVPHWREAVAALAEGHDFHRAPLVESDVGLPLVDPSGPSPAGEATITSFAPERVVLDVDASAPSLLVLAEAWYPGWSATVDGTPAACLPANAWMRAVPVPPGRHEVELRFHSRWLLPGALLSLLTAGTLALLARRDRRPRTGGGGARVRPTGGSAR